MDKSQGIVPARIEYTKDNIGVVLYSEGIVTGEELIAGCMPWIIRISGKSASIL